MIVSLAKAMFSVREMLAIGLDKDNFPREKINGHGPRNAMFPARDVMAIGLGKVSERCDGCRSRKGRCSPRDAMAVGLERATFLARNAMAVGLVLGERRDSHGPRNAMATGLEVRCFRRET